MNIIAQVLVALLGGGFLALLGMRFLHDQPVDEDSDIHGGSV